MHRPFLLAISLFLLAAAMPAHSQPLEAYRNGRVETVSEDNEYWLMLQDRQGFLWGYNRENEVVRYDGNSFHTFRPNPNDTSTSRVLSLVPPTLMKDSKGNLWFTYLNGLDRYNPETERFEHFQDRIRAADGHGPSGYYLTFEDSRGNIWVGGQRGLYAINASRDSIHSVKPSQHNQFFMEDEEGFVWVYMGSPSSIPGALFKIAPATFKTLERVSPPSVHPDFFGAPSWGPYQGRLFTPFPDVKHTLLLVLDGQVFAFNTKTLAFQLLSKGLYEDEMAWSLYREGNTTLIGTSKGRVLEFDASSGAFFEFLQIPGGAAPDETVLQLFKSREGLLWITTSHRTFRVMPRETAFHYTPFPVDMRIHESGGSHDELVSFNGEVYFNTTGGLIPVIPGPGSQTIPLEIGPADFLPLKKPSGVKEDMLIKNTQFLFAEDTLRNKLWLMMGQYPFGMKMIAFDALGRKLDFYSCNGRDSACFTDHFLEMAIDENGHIWMAGWAGVAHFDPDTRIFQNFRYKKEAKNSLSEANTVDLAIARNGEVWIGYPNRGISRYTPSSNVFTHFTHDPKDPGSLGSNNWTLDMLEDKSGRIWLSSIGGLSRWDPASQSFSRYGNEKGLPSNSVFSLIEDPLGRIWGISTEHLSIFEKGRNGFWAMGKKDGLGGRFVRGKALADAHGHLFFAGEKGVAWVYAAEIQPDNIVPPLVLTGFIIDNQLVKPGDTTGVLSKSIGFTAYLELAFLQRNFSIQYAALEYLHPEKVRYAYKLEGYDEGWNEVGDQRTATFTNLPPGQYTFLLKCYNRHGFESPEPLALAIRILPPWYRTWWAWSLWIALIAGTIYWIYRFLLRRQLALSEARQLRELDAAKTKLYTNISHEFRTPLTVILGNAGLLEKDVSPAGRNMLKGIRNSGQDLLQLVNQLLDLAKLESGKMALNLSQGDVVLFSRYLLKSFHSLAEQKGISLRFESEAESFYMDFDPEKLKQALSNLLSNAIKFTPEGGVVSVQLAVNSRQSAVGRPKLHNANWKLPTETCLLLTVRDNGPGIAPEQLPHIFDRFFQVDPDSYRSTTRKGEGTGIGLTLTKELVQLMGGQISVKSEPGVGSEFSIALPVTRKAGLVEVDWEFPEKNATSVRSPKKASPPLVSDLPGVLIVEDHAEVAAYIQKCLAGKYAIRMATDGKMGLEMARTEVPDLIISDVMMPEMDGYELTRTLKDDLLTCHIPVILLTARADVGSRIEGWEKGADEYLAKPFHERELNSRIKNLLEIRRKLQERFAAGSKPAFAQPFSDDPLIRRAVQLIEQDLTVQWDAESLAAALFVSQTQLYRKLKSITGKHITEFVRYVRLQEAVRLMAAYPDKKVAAVSYEVGFSTPQEFSRRFKEQFGVTPGQWREG